MVKRGHYIKGREEFIFVCVGGKGRSTEGKRKGEEWKEEGRGTAEGKY